MSSPSRPLAYESRKVLLEHLDFNIRIQLSLRCPSIRVTEKLVPLKLCHLTLGNCTTKVNDTTYQLEIVKQLRHPGEQLPRLGFNRPEVGPIQKDIDTVGLADPSAVNIMTPGDLNLRHRDHRTLPETNMEYRIWEDRLERQATAALTKLDSSRNKYGARMDYEGEVNRAHAELVRFRQKDFYNLHLKFTVTSPNREYTEILEYNKKIYEAHKYMNVSLFGNRPQVISVDMLALGDCEHIFRLPINFKVRTKELKAGFVDFNHLNETVEFSEPYNITLDYTLSGNSLFGQQVYERAKQLTILGPISYRRFQHLENLEVRFLNSGRPIAHQVFRHLIQDWMEDGKPVGTIYTFGRDTEAETKECFEALKSGIRERVLVNHKRFFTVPMPDGSSILRVSWEQVLREPSVNDYFVSYWCLIWRVELDD